jgi:hypothetical protein
MADDAMKHKTNAQVRNPTRLAKSSLSWNRSVGADDSFPPILSECFNDVEKTLA